MQNKINGKHMYQYNIDFIYDYLKISKTRKCGPWLYCIHTETMVAIKGYDEDLVGYGREDDDIYDRLKYKLSLGERVVNNNISCIHVFHNTAGPGGKRDTHSNDEIYRKKKVNIASNYVRNNKQWGDLKSGVVVYAYRDIKWGA